MADPQRAGLKHFSWPDHVATTSQGSDKETLLRSCPQPRNRRHAHVIAAPNLRERFHALVPPLDRLAALMLRQLVPASWLQAPRLGALPAFTHGCANQRAVELSQPADDGEHQAGVRRRRVGPSVAKRAESGAWSVMVPRVLRRSRVERAKIVSTSPLPSCARTRRNCPRSARRPPAL